MSLLLVLPALSRLAGAEAAACASCAPGTELQAGPWQPLPLRRWWPVLELRGGGRERERAGREERNWSMRKRGRGRGRTSVDDDDDDGCKSIELRSRLEKRTYQRQARFVSCCNARRRRPATQRRSRRRSLLLLLQRRRSRWRRRRRRRRRGGTLDGDISFAGFVALMLRLLFLVAARSIVLFARHCLKTLSLSLSDSQGERPSRERGGKRRKRTKEKKCEFEGDGSLC